MIFFPLKLFESIEAAGEESYPREACGLILGNEDCNSKKIVTQVIKSQNVTNSDPLQNFQIDPQVQFDTIRMLEKQNNMGTAKTKIIGHYHSHPDQSAYPSKKDISLVYQLNLFWIITSVVNKKSIDTKAYIFNKQVRAFDKLELHIWNKNV